MSKNKNRSEIVRLGTIIGSFVLGWGLTIGGFIVPPLGVIDNSVLVVLGQAMCYSGAGLGIRDYVRIQIAKEIKKDIDEDESVG